MQLVHAWTDLGMCGGVRLHSHSSYDKAYMWQESLSCIGPSVWNKLPSSIKRNISLNKFTHYVKKHSLQELSIQYYYYLIFLSLLLLLLQLLFIILMLLSYYYCCCCHQYYLYHYHYYCYYQCYYCPYIYVFVP